MTDRQITHAPSCWDWGPRHYECALREIERLRKLLDRMVVCNPDGSVGIRVTADALNAAAELYRLEKRTAPCADGERAMTDRREEWVLVPKKPTLEMSRAVREETRFCDPVGIYQKMLAVAPTHPAITHCDNCGCDWLDNGLNPVGCPYCKQSADAKSLVTERDALEAENERLRAEMERLESTTAVDEAMVERIAALLYEEATDEPWTVAGVEYEGPDRDYYRGLARKVAALTAQQPAGDEVVFYDGVGAARNSVKSCRDGVQWIMVGDRVYWPLSDSDAKRLHNACCGNGSFDGPSAPSDDLPTLLDNLMRAAFDDGDRGREQFSGATMAAREAVLAHVRSASAPSNAPVGMETIREAFDEISGLCRHLRQGGPAPEDLQALSDALDEAVGIAANMLHALAQQPAAVTMDEAMVEAVARAICVACEENPDRQGDARGNEFRWQDYRDTALAAISVLTAAQQPAEQRAKVEALREALAEAEEAMRFAHTSCATFPQEPQHVQNAAWRRIVNAIAKARAVLEQEDKA